MTSCLDKEAQQDYWTVLKGTTSASASGTAKLAERVVQVTVLPRVAGVSNITDTIVAYPYL